MVNNEKVIILMILPLIISLAYNGVSFSANKQKIKLFPFKQNEKWGFIDETGNVVIKAKFEEVKYFQNGLAVAAPYKDREDFKELPPDYHNRKYGYIDKTGNWVIKPHYTRAYSFAEGLGLVSQLPHPNQ